MSDIKEVNIIVPDKKTKSRRLKHQVQNPEIGEIVEKKIVQVPRIIQSAGVPLPILSTTHAVGGRKINTPQHILTKANIGKINNTSTPYNESPLTPSPTIFLKPKATMKAPSKVILSEIKPESVEKRPLLKKNTELPKINIHPIKRKNFTIKRNFKEKTIVVKIDNSKKIRKTRDNIRRTVANMDLSEVNSNLQKRGLIKMNSTMPPEMQRSMMIDILMFPTPM